MTKGAEVLFAPYMSKAFVNNVEMSILRDSGATNDLLSSNYVRAEDYRGETIWVKQPLDVNFNCLLLAKVELQSPDFGRIITNAAIIDSSLDNGIYLLGNGTANLISEQKQTTNLNAVITRSHQIISPESYCHHPESSDND
ncbi:hypothetical protein HNY73_010007 [Argiope bruennichi]|uniref:Uncharacterized protein n=1 Tax=Argiope bruennichi TaxID=94029 RepID=A0A8T0F0F8_ARGBR|nr:hypothetical protein HNY73_010007 [Argiope bruennichi]